MNCYNIIRKIFWLNCLRHISSSVLCFLCLTWALAKNISGAEWKSRTLSRTHRIIEFRAFWKIPWRQWRTSSPFTMKEPKVRRGEVGEPCHCHLRVLVLLGAPAPAASWLPLVCVLVTDSTTNWTVVKISHLGGTLGLGHITGLLSRSFPVTILSGGGVGWGKSHPWDLWASGSLQREPQCGQMAIWDLCQEPGISRPSCRYWMWPWVSCLLPFTHALSFTWNVLSTLGLCSQLVKSPRASAHTASGKPSFMPLLSPLPHHFLSLTPTVLPYTHLYT